LNVTTESCYNLVIAVELDGKPLAPPQRAPIGSILTTVQYLKQMGRPLKVCQNLTASCSVCEEITQINLNTTSGKLHLCVKPAPQCDLIPIPLPTREMCLDLNNCGVFSCLNQCAGHGKCGTLGCTCDAGYFGADCSLHVKDNCVENVLRPEKICWNAEPTQLQNKCNKELSFQVEATWASTNNVKVAMTDTKVHDFLKCEPGAFGANPPPVLRNCTNCLDMDNITLVNHRLMGCPTLRLNCLGQDILASQLTCVKLAESPSLETSCASTPTTPGVPTVPSSSSPQPEPQPDTDQLTTGTLYTAAVIIGVVVVIIGAGGYFAWMHYKDRQSAQQIDDERELSMSLSEDEELDRQASTSLNSPGNDIDLSSSDE